MNCPTCAAALPDEAAFCGQCGSALRSERSCARCGKVNTPEMRFCLGCGNPLSPTAPEHAPRTYTPKHLAEKILTTRAALEGERKQVTVLFADVKGSMELAERLDPEEWHGIMDRFFQLLTDGVHRFEGTVNQYTGDGVMALFGAPIAHEDHAQRACWAALHLRDALRAYADELRLSRGLNFSVRTGLNSGEVVVGRIGDDLRMDYTAQGHTVGLAQRMEQIAEPGCVYLTGHTAALVHGFFRLRDLGPLTVKGVRDPLRVYELEGVGSLRTKLDVSRARGFSRFVGREGETAALEAALARATQGDSQVVGVVADAGVGKSRLCFEFSQRCRARGLAVHEAHAVAHGKAIPFFTLLEYLRGYFGISERDPPLATREKIAGKVLLLDPELTDALPLLFDLLGVPDPERPVPRMDPEAHQRQLFAAMRRLTHAQGRRVPGVALIEDLHWIDGGSEAFLANFVETLPATRNLLVVNFRPEYHAGWMQKSYYQQLPLVPLGPEAMAELLRDLLGSDPSLAGLAERIRERTGGNPFFIEEIVQALVEGDSLEGTRGAYRLARPVEQLTLPATVQAVLAARIDRLGEREKAVLQTAAVIGREFAEPILQRVAARPETELRAALQTLVRAEFLYEAALFPEFEYAFKHPLTQEVAYSSLLLERRKALHERTAQAIEALHAGHLDERYGELAHHYGQGGNVPKAVEYLRQAGQQAIRRSAYVEGIEQLKTALDMLVTLPTTPERARSELSLQVVLAPALMATKGFAALEVQRAAARAKELSEELGETPQLAPALWVRLWAPSLLRGDLHRAREAADRIFALAHSVGDTDLILEAHSLRGQTFFYLGDLVTAREHLEQAIARYDVRQHASHSFTYGEDPGVGARNHAAWLLWLVGSPEQALCRSNEALALARELAHPHDLAYAVGFAGCLRLFRREGRAAEEQGDAQVALAREHGFSFWLAMGTVVRGGALIEHGRTEEGIAELTEGLAAWRATGSELSRPYWLALLAGAQLTLGRASDAAALLDEAEVIVERTGERWYEAEVHRLRSEIALRAGDHAEAERSSLCAVEVARRHGAKSLELRAVTSSARLLRSQGRREEARLKLIETCGSFTEGFDTRDLREAKALLEGLG